MSNISVPSTGQWIEKRQEFFFLFLFNKFQYPLRANGLRSPLEKFLIEEPLAFQYPLRANGLRSLNNAEPPQPPQAFQYPLRANRLRSTQTKASTDVRITISVPSTGQWIEKPSLALWPRVGRLLFQYPLRANGLRSEGVYGKPLAVSVFQYPLRANGLRSARQADETSGADVISVPSTGQWIEKHIQRT